MTTITLAYFTQLAQDANGAEMPMGTGFLGGEVLTDFDESAAAPSGTKMVRIATDSDCLVDAYGASAGQELLMPAGTVEFFPAATAQTFTFTELA